MKYYPLLIVSMCCGLTLTDNAAANEQPQQFAPAVALLFDYVNTESDMYGITLAPRHYDPNYAAWGYYIGYVKGNKTNLHLPEPNEGYLKEYMWRFGLSYSLTENISLYGGATHYTYETNTTNNIVPLIEGAEPEWKQNNERHWGAEVGMRYRIAQKYMLGVGYDSYTQAAIISVGFTL
ncbi:TonB-dependent receptor [Shewanella intestini]|uniref:TonB-dependent receptor n=1 Tax=Shewanella intestini TaxID=2017544 RepID=A0ABS5I3L0_9GAMM|nr:MULTISPECIES: TonB-dependent receptor [Shewanella]MBR9728612.1 TonB-dependent receptor [Shewanella intestini]MRG37332.1 TonB-dependent receptor [Shewanella sp. XMDDZSB0408]